MTDEFPKEYLGDGVYASFDGWHVWLEGNAEDRVNRIALEPQVVVALMRYHAGLLDALAAEDEEARPDGPGEAAG